MNNQNDFDLGAFLFIQDSLDEIKKENNSCDKVFDYEEEIEDKDDNN